MTYTTDQSVLQQVAARIERLYWDALRNGGPDVELLAILRQLEIPQNAGNELCRHCGRLGDKGAGYCSRACHAAAEGLDAPDEADIEPSAGPTQQQRAFFPERGYGGGA
jgi:hypothetical protein